MAYINEEREYERAYIKMLESRISTVDALNVLESNGWKKYKSTRSASYEVRKRVNGIYISVGINYDTFYIHMYAEFPNNMDNALLDEFNTATHVDPMTLNDFAGLDEFLNVVDSIANKTSIAANQFKPKRKTMDYTDFEYNGEIGNKALSIWQDEVSAEIMRTVELGAANYEGTVASMRADKVYGSYRKSLHTEENAGWANGLLIAYLLDEGGPDFGAPWYSAADNGKSEIRKVIYQLIKSGKLVRAKAPEINLEGVGVYYTTPEHMEWGKKNEDV